MSLLIESLMMVLLLAGFALIAWSFYIAHRSPAFAFNLFDLLMEHGKVSKISVAFMLTLAFTTWLMLDLQLKGKMSEGYFTTYGTFWIVPLVARVIFGKRENVEIETAMTTKTTTTQAGGV